MYSTTATSHDIPPMTYDLPATEQLTGAGKFQAKWAYRIKTLYKWIGPTWLIACTLLDPGAIEGALDQGAFTGYPLIWVTLWSTVMVLLFQSAAAYIGIITGKSLAEVIKESRQYKRKGFIRYVIWWSIELSVIFDDLQALIGVTVALQILGNIPFWAAVLLTIVLTMVLTYAYYRAPYKLETLVGLCLFTMLLCYFVNAIQSAAPAGSVFYGAVVPTIPSYGVLQLVGSFGGIVTPSALFLGSALVLNRQVDRSSDRDVREAMNYSFVELSIGMVMSFLCNLFVVITFASSFFNSDCADQGLALVDGQCDDIGLDDAPDALSKLYGNASTYLFGIALLFAGSNSMISATLAGQVTFDGFADIKLAFWERIVITRAVTLGPVIAIAVTAGNNQLEYSIVNEWMNLGMSCIMPLALIPTVHIISSRIYVGSYALKIWHILILTALVLLVIVLNFYLMFGFIFQPDEFGSVGSFPDTPAFYWFIGVVMTAYTYFLYEVSIPAFQSIWAYLYELKKVENTNWLTAYGPKPETWKSTFWLYAMYHTSHVVDMVDIINRPKQVGTIAEAAPLTRAETGTTEGVQLYAPPAI